ncbi:conserved hypothetical protein [Aeropyrum pernix K1]|uniref:tRNA (pseudouridine(54)-N(1))-methyltransferase n=1 Tax=Aeropyrum pernix (strain ATCC 700893 / DSM 11879 / JCM 9820 / NBRC 100138 / K1) TaxID=272557 RepID=TRMY_AERPE|nr:tRNA (pseudouridine-N1)-methyltransferase [Aeropyrum pernix]Q9YDX2.1 RecName: Full=tRNA (pseudouridine(54)-N(1))-methyltransferase [Aeropyrum pernix K1]BAA79775.1 conserved hypothetical protein [Aeropyrum pernix K1]
MSLYVVISPTGRTDGNIPARGYAGPSGRLDVIARAYNAILEPNATLAALLMGGPLPPRLLIAPLSCKDIVRSERSFMIEASRALRGRRSCFTVNDEGVEALASLLRRFKPRILLAEKGGDISSHWGEMCSSSPTFIAGSHLDPPHGLIKHLERSLGGFLRVSVGPLSLHTDHVFLLVSALRLPMHATSIEHH